MQPVPALRRSAVALAVSLLAAAGCGIGQENPSPTVDRDDYGTATVSRMPLSDVQRGHPQGIVVVDGTITVWGRTYRLARTPYDGLSGSLAPWVTLSPDQSFFLYTTWEDTRSLDDLEVGEAGGRPTIRRVDASTGEDTLFRDGAYAPAISNSGRIAYVEDADGVYRFSVPNPTRLIVVLGSGDAVWAESLEFRHLIFGWAGDSLIVHEVHEGEYLRTFAYHGADDRSPLSEGGTIAAISPDGSRVLLIEDGTDVTTALTLVDTRGLRVWTGEFETDMGTLAFVYRGHWSENRIALAAGIRDQVVDDYAKGFALLDYTGEALTLVRSVVIDGPELPISVMSPRFVEGGGVWIRLGYAEPMDGSWEVRYLYQDALCTEKACLRVEEPRDFGQEPIVVGSPD